MFYFIKSFKVVKQSNKILKIKIKVMRRYKNNQDASLDRLQ